MIGQRHYDYDRERRREAVRVGRKGIGRRLELMLEGVVRAPVPPSWLELLRLAEERAAADEDEHRESEH
jgi:hypothetical protein